MRNRLFLGISFNYSSGVNSERRQETMNELKEKEVQELSKEEINVYAAGCGEIQNHCKNDCFGGGSFLNPD